MARGLATLATTGAALLVLLLFVPTLQAPFLVPKFAALELAASLGLVAFALRRAAIGGLQWTRPVTVGALLVLATTAVAWMTATGKPPGAPYAVSAMARWGSLFGLACGVSVLDDAVQARRRVLEAVTIAAAAVAAIGLLQHLEVMPFAIPVISKPGSTFGNRNAAAEVMAMALPLGLGAAAGTRRSDARNVMLVALALELVFLGVTRARGAWVGAACGLGIALWLCRPRWSRASIAIALGAVVAGSVAASLPGRFNPRDAGDRKRYSGVVEVLQDGFDTRSTALKTRFGLWRRTVAMVRDHPLFGVGPGNWPVMFPRYAEPGATSDGVLSASLAPRQAHEDALERAAETGVPGLLALGVLAVGAVIAVRRRLGTGDQDMRATTAAAAGTLVSLVALSIASFPLEMPGTLAVAGVALGLIAADTKGHVARRASLVTPRVAVRALACVPVAVGLGLLSVAAVRAERSVRSSRWLGMAERAMHRERGARGASEALVALNRALKAMPSDYRAQLRSAQMLLREGHSLESERAARRALALEPYAPNAWAALAAAELSGGAHEAARRDASEALALLHDHPFALQLRARAAEQEGDLPSAQADRQRLDLLATGPEDDATAQAARELLHPTD
jgi:O-antigen ligase